MENILLPIPPIPPTPDSLEPADATPPAEEFAEVLAHCFQGEESKAEPMEGKGDNSAANILFPPWAFPVPISQGYPSMISEGDPIAANPPGESPIAPVPEWGSSVPLPLLSPNQSKAQNPEPSLNPFPAQPLFDSEDLESGSPHSLGEMEDDLGDNPIPSPGENVVSSLSLLENLASPQPQNTQDSLGLNLQNISEKLAKSQMVGRNIPIVQEEVKPGKSSSRGQETGTGDPVSSFPLEEKNKGGGVLQREFLPSTSVANASSPDATRANSGFQPGFAARIETEGKSLGVASNPRDLTGTPTGRTDMIENSAGGPIASALEAAWTEGGKTQEKFPWPVNQHSPFNSQKEIRNYLGISDASPGLREIPTHAMESPSPLIEKHIPALLKTENLPIAQQISQGALWSIRNNEEKVRISLDPPELGHVYLEIHRKEGKIQTTLWTDNPVTKLTLESGQPDIQRIIENEGFKLEKFDVFVEQDMAWFQGRKENSRNPEHWEGPGSAEEKEASPAPEPLSPLRRTANRARTYLDVFV